MEVSISTLIASMFFILLAFSVLGVLLGFNVGIIVGVDLAVFSIVFLIYGAKVKKEGIFYAFWGLLTLVLAITTMVSTVYGFIYGLIALFIGIGVLILYAGKRKTY